MLQKSSVWKTASVFFIGPTREHYLLDISRSTGQAHTSVKKNLDYLVGSGMVLDTVVRKGKRKFPLYRANSESKLFRRCKLLNNLDMLMGCGLLEHIEETLMPKCIVLFGSYSRGEDVESSDIDLFIECKEGQLDLDQFEKKLARKIELHFSEDFSKYPRELRNNIANGIVLMGYLEVFK